MKKYASSLPIEDCTIGIVGLGLMGGAIAAALRNCGAAAKRQILACDTSEETLAQALAAGLIDEGFTENEGTQAAGETLGVSEMLRRCDLVFLCLNPSTLLRFMEKRMGDFREGALITDIAGRKAGSARLWKKRSGRIWILSPVTPWRGRKREVLPTRGS